MILVERGNVQLSIEERELEKYIAMGFVKYEAPKVEIPKEAEKKVEKPAKSEKKD